MNQDMAKRYADEEKEKLFIHTKAYNFGSDLAGKLTPEEIIAYRGLSGKFTRIDHTRGLDFCHCGASVAGFSGPHQGNIAVSLISGCDERHILPLNPSS